MTLLAETGTSEVRLRDGTTVRIRPLEPEDEPMLAGFLERLSPRSRAFRFFGAGVDVRLAAHGVCNVDDHDRYGVVAIAGGRIAGHAMYARLRPGAVEVAFAVADELQGRGLGTALLVHIAKAAHDHGFEILEADVLPQNHRMLELFAESGFPLEIRTEPGVVHVRARGDDR